MAAQSENTSFAKSLKALRREDEKTGKRVGQILRQTDEGLKEADLFFRAVQRGDGLGITYYRKVMGYPPGKAAITWYAKPGEAWLEFIAGFAKGEGDTAKAAKHILKVYNAFAVNQILREAVASVVTEVMRPARLIYGKGEFTFFLHSLVEKSLALELSERPGWGKAFQWEGKWYRPTSLEKARLAWPFVVKTLIRVREYTTIAETVLPRIKFLLDRATIPSDLDAQGLSRLATGEEGSLVIWDTKSRIGQDDVGLLAILITRLDAASNMLYLEGSVADRSFPSSMGGAEESVAEKTDFVSYELPGLIVQARHDGTLEVGFGALSGYPKEEHGALLRAQRLLRWRASQEGALPRIPELSAPKAETPTDG